MNRISVFDIVKQPVLVSRESARVVKSSLPSEETTEGGPLVLDFSGARGVAPSFLDESLLVAEEYLEESKQPDTTIVFEKPPTSLAAKHHAIARAHGRTLVETEDGDWEFRKL